MSTKTLMHVWVYENIESHGIYDSTTLKKQFTEETGRVACWRDHGVLETKAAIAGRGLGGDVKASSPDERCAYGWEIAEALAFKYAGYKGSLAMGRGRRFYDALEALKKADV